MAVITTTTDPRASPITCKSTPVGKKERPIKPTWHSLTWLPKSMNTCCYLFSVQLEQQAGFESKKQWPLLHRKQNLRPPSQDPENLEQPRKILSCRHLREEGLCQFKVPHCCHLPPIRGHQAGNRRYANGFFFFQTGVCDLNCFKHFFGGGCHATWFVGS